MVNICTVSDINYLEKGLALYESLLEHSKNTVLHYLCIDDKSYSMLKKIENESLKAYNVNDLLEKDATLLALKNKNYRYFCWSLASYFSNYLLTNDEKCDSITYIDSDILMHDDVQKIFSEIGNREIGIFRHRQFNMGENRPEGLFNVGIVYFKKGDVGQHILKWWADAVLNQKYPHLSTCGDQKYLDEFQNMCPDDLLFIDGEIGHGAPWQWQLYDFSTYENDGCITWNGKKQKLIFSHFSQFVYENDTYVPSAQHHIYTPLESYKNISGLKMIYDDYYNKLKQIKTKYLG